MTEVLILSIVQGITEFIPVSSSSHLVILTKLMNFSGGVLLDISVHIGSFFAVIIYFRKDLIDYSKNLKILSLFLIASIPVKTRKMFRHQTTGRVDLGGGTPPRGVTPPTLLKEHAKTR